MPGKRSSKKKKPTTKPRKKKVDPQNELFEVEVLTMARIARVTDKKSANDPKSIEGVEWEYRVKWAGYTSDSDSWEPEANLSECKDMLSGFWDSIQQDIITLNMNIGEEVAPSDDWINQQRLPFKATEANSSNDKTADISDDNSLESLKRASTSTVKLSGTTAKPKRQEQKPEVSKNTPPMPLFLPSESDYDTPPMSPSLDQSSGPSSSYLAPESLDLSDQNKDHIINVFSDQMFDTGLLSSTVSTTSYVEALEGATDPQSRFMMDVDKLYSLPVIDFKIKGIVVGARIVRIERGGDCGPVQEEMFPSELSASQTYSSSDARSLLSLHSLDELSPRYLLHPLDTNSNLFEILTRYLVKHLQVIVTPIYDGLGITIGHYFIIPFESVFASLLSDLSLCATIQNLDPDARVPQLFLIPLSLSNRGPTNDLSSSRSQFSPIDVSALQRALPMREVELWNTALKQRPWFFLGLNALCMPLEILTWIETFPETPTYLMWDGHNIPPPDTSEPACISASAEAMIESKMLSEILGVLGLKKADNQASACLLFVHAESLLRPDIRSRLADLKCICNPALVTIFRYGSKYGRVHEIEEIYPCGGIVTFTPRALLEGRSQSFRLIDKLHEHPLWASYVIPLTLGILIYRCNIEKDIDIVEKRVLTTVFDKIALGNIALITSTPPSSAADPKHARRAWLSQFLSAIPPTPIRASTLSLLELQRFSQQPDNGQILDEISKDILAMQLEPSMIRDYRRFVVVMSDSEAKELGNERRGKDGAEWITISEFEFGDRFFDEC